MPDLGQSEATDQTYFVRLFGHVRVKASTYDEAIRKASDLVDDVEVAAVDAWIEEDR